MNGLMKLTVSILLRVPRHMLSMVFIQQGSAKTIVIQVAAVQKERPLNGMDVYLNELLKSRAKQLYDQHVSTCCSEQSEVLGECCAFLEVPVTKFMP